MLKRILPAILSIFFTMLCWQLTVQATGLPHFILPAPADVWSRFLRALNDGSLLYHTRITLLEIVLGLLAGILVATMVGYALAKSRTLETVLVAVSCGESGDSDCGDCAAAHHLAGRWDSLEGGHLRVDRILPCVGEHRCGCARRTDRALRHDALPCVPPAGRFY
jgi:hypothetical protein